MSLEMSESISKSVSAPESSATPRFPHLRKSFGVYETNCYIIQTPSGELIIDPGMGSASWVLESCENPLAILLTHGHFDHIYDVAALKSALPDIPLYCPRDDSFMLESDCFDTGLVPYKPSERDVLVPCEKGQSDVVIAGIACSFIHFPGHTPGCSVICVGDRIYSGDFIFKRSIGRYDFPYSSAADMRDSLLRFRELEIGEHEIFPGHGESTLLSYEQNNIELWLGRM